MLIVLTAVLLGAVAALVLRGRARWCGALAVPSIFMWSAACGWLTLPCLAIVQGFAPSIERPLFAQRNIIVVLGEGTYGRLLKVGEPELFQWPSADGDKRLEAAARLYKSCQTSTPVRGALPGTLSYCRVLISGGDPRHFGDNEAHVYAPYLERMGVPESDILLETKSISTAQNAKFSAVILREQKPQAVLLISSAYQIKRALGMFQAVGFPYTQPVIANRRGYQLSGWPNKYAYQSSGAAMHEVAALGYYYLQRLFGKV